MSVHPRSADQRSMWCASQYEAGRSQPCQRHPPSRIASASRCRAVNSRDGARVVFEMPDPGTTAALVSECLGRDDHPHAGLACAEHGLGVGEGSRAEHVEEQVVRELVVGARIGRQLLRPLPLVGIDEPGATAAGPQRGIQHRGDPRATEVVERDRPAPDAVAVGPGAERAAREPGVEAAFGALGIEVVAHGARRARQFFHGARERLVDELNGGEGPRVAGRGIRLCVVDGRWFAETAEDRVAPSRRRGRGRWPR